MANWTETTLRVLLPKTKEDLFVSFFESRLMEKPAACNLDGIIQTINEDETSIELELPLACRWSVEGTLVNLPDEDKKSYTDFLDIAKLCDVTEAYMYSKEPGINFEEMFVYHAGDEKITVYSRDDIWNEIPSLL